MLSTFGEIMMKFRARFHVSRAISVKSVKYCTCVNFFGYCIQQIAEFFFDSEKESNKVICLRQEKSKIFPDGGWDDVVFKDIASVGRANR